MENSVMVQFRGWAIDVFETSDPTRSIGLTVERAPAHEDNPSVDIFVTDNDDRTFSVKSSDAASDPGGLLLRKAQQELLTTGVSVESAFALLLDAMDKKQREELLGTNMYDVFEWAGDVVAALKGHLTEQGTTTDHDALLKRIGCPYMR